MFKLEFFCINKKWNTLGCFSVGLDNMCEGVFFKCGV